jgi:hypothetical protein
MCSSAFSTLDLHHEMVEAGDTDDTMVAAAPTWEARPALTIDECRKLEPDEETMQREYGNRPMGSTEREFFDAFAVDAAVDKSIELGAILLAPGVRVTCGADLAFERNAAALAVCHASGAGDAEKYAVADVLELKPEPGAPLRPGEVIDAFAQKMRGHGCQWMMADGHYRMSAIEHLERHVLHFADAPTGIIGKSETFVRTRVLLHGGRLRLPNHPLLLGQLKRTKGQPTAGGAMSIRVAPDASGRHGDILSAVVLAIWQRSGYVVAPAPTVEDEGAKLKAEAIRAAGERQRKAEKWLRRALR